MRWRSSRRVLQGWAGRVGFDDEDKHVCGLQMLMKQAFFFLSSIKLSCCFVLLFTLNSNHPDSRSLTLCLLHPQKKLALENTQGEKRRVKREIKRHRGG